MPKLELKILADDPLEMIETLKSMLAGWEAGGDIAVVPPEPKEEEMIPEPPKKRGRPPKKKADPEPKAEEPEEKPADPHADWKVAGDLLMAHFAMGATEQEEVTDLIKTYGVDRFIDIPKDKGTELLAKVKSELKAHA